MSSAALAKVEALMTSWRVDSLCPTYKDLLDLHALLQPSAAVASDPARTVTALTRCPPERERFSHWQKGCSDARSGSPPALPQPASHEQCEANRGYLNGFEYGQDNKAVL